MHTPNDLFIEANNLQRRLRFLLCCTYQAVGDCERLRKISKVLDRADTRTARRRKALILHDARRAAKVSFKTMMRGYAERQI